MKKRLRVKSGGSGGSGVSERSARQGHAEPAPSAWARLRQDARARARTSDASTLQQYHDHRHEAPNERGTAEQRALDLVRGLGELDGRGHRRWRSGEVGTVDVENLEQDEGADRGRYPDDIGGEPPAAINLTGRRSSSRAEVPPGRQKSACSADGRHSICTMDGHQGAPSSQLINGFIEDHAWHRLCGRTT